MFPLLVLYQEAITYSEVFLISNTSKRMGLHHNFIIREYGSWLIGVNSHIIWIISLCKTRGQVFLDKGRFDENMRAKLDHTWPWWGPCMERFMEDVMVHGLIRVL